MALALGGLKMFDKLIETEPEGADFHNRRSYFMVSSIVVGALFITVVVISIYASDYGLGRDNFELSMIVTPPEIAPADPIPQQPRIAVNQSQPQNLLPAKPTFVAPMSDTKTIPTTISTAQLTALTWNSPNPAPIGAENPNGLVSGRETNEPGNGTVGIGNQTEPTEPASIPEPPPVIKKPVEAKPTILKSDGVINGKATYLPKPDYPAAAKAVNIQGMVNVQVMIDENGKVISANAVSGHPFLKPAAERAAWQAKFSTTYLSKVPVKVTGVIVYNFTR